MPGDIVTVDHIDEIPLGVTRQCGLTEMRIFRKISRRLGVKVREVAASATRHQDFTSGFFAIIQQQNPAATLSGLCRTEHTCSTCTNDDHINLFHFWPLFMNIRLRFR